jgi:peptidoglycan/LPS O-acetylase OafA/YrhL
MTLSHREQQILDEIAKRLAEQDPALVAGLARSRPAAHSRVSVPLGLQALGALVLALVVLILVSASVGELGTAETAIVTCVLIVPWLVVTARSAGRPRTSPDAERTTGRAAAEEPQPPR